MTFGKDISKRMSTADIFFNPAGKATRRPKIQKSCCWVFDCYPQYKKLYLLDYAYSARDALWVYLTGRSPPVRRTCIKGCPVGIPCWTKSARPKDMY